MLPILTLITCLPINLLAIVLTLTDSQGSGCSQGTTHLKDDGDVVVESSVASQVRR